MQLREKQLTEIRKRRNLGAESAESAESAPCFLSNITFFLLFLFWSSKKFVSLHRLSQSVVGGVGQDIDGQRPGKPFVRTVSKRRLLNVIILCYQTSQL